MAIQLPSLTDTADWPGFDGAYREDPTACCPSCGGLIPPEGSTILHERWCPEPPVIPVVAVHVGPLCAYWHLGDTPAPYCDHPSCTQISWEADVA